MAGRRRNNPRRSPPEKAPRAGYRPDERPYLLLGRELRDRIDGWSGGTAAFVEAVEGQLEGTRDFGRRLQDAQQGRRNLAPGELDAIGLVLSAGNSGALARASGTGAPNEDPHIRLLKVLANEPKGSRTRLVHGMQAPVRVGVVAYHPFATSGDGEQGEAGGLVPDLLKIFFALLQVKVRWAPLKWFEMIPSLDSGDVDLVVGLILNTARRASRAHFAPLNLPFTVGLNAVCDRQLVNQPRRYAEASLRIRQLMAERRASPLRIVAARGELAHEYLPAVLPGIPVDVQPADELAGFVAGHAQGGRAVVFADDVSCRRACQLNGDLTLVFQPRIGEFRGGILLPKDDVQWSTYVSEALFSFFRSQLPAALQVIAKAAGDLKAYLPEDPMELEEWRKLFWSTKHVEFPADWKPEQSL